jgi:hypothetical protein
VQIPTQQKLNPLFSSERPSKTSGRSSVNHIRLDDVGIPFRLPSMSRSFKQFKVASVWTSWQHIRTPFRVREDSSVPMHPSGRRGNTIRTPFRVRGELGFPSQIRIWENSCICSDVRSTPSGHQSTPS